MGLDSLSQVLAFPLTDLYLIGRTVFPMYLNLNGFVITDQEEVTEQNTFFFPFVNIPVLTYSIDQGLRSRGRGRVGTCPTNIFKIIKS